MADITDAEIDQALQRGQEVLRLEPRAKSVSFDPTSGRVAIELTNGGVFTLPARRIEGLAGADDHALGRIAILGIGTGVSWPDLDVDVTIAGLLAGRFGSAGYMRKLVREAEDRAAKPA